MLRKFANKVDLILRGYVARHIPKTLFLHGANMAIRKSAWTKIKSKLCTVPGIHEDYDLAIHLSENGAKVIYREDIVAGVSIRRYGSSFFEFIRYTLVAPRSYAAHNLRYERYFLPVLLCVWALYVPAHFLYLAFDKSESKLSWQAYMENRKQFSRVNPATFMAYDRQ